MIASIFVVLVSLSPELERDFAAANERALKGDHTGAIALYQSLQNRGLVAPDLYYNLGVAYAEAAQPVDAIVQFERALRLDPGHADAEHNLGQLRAELTPKSEAQVLSFADALQPLLPPWSLMTSFFVAISLSLLTFGALIWARFVASAWPRRMFVASAISLAIVGAILGAQIIVATAPRAVIVRAAELRQGPDERLKSAGEAVLGLRVRILSREAGWVEVQNPDGTVGWLPESALAIL